MKRTFSVPNNPQVSRKTLSGHRNLLIQRGLFFEMDFRESTLCGEVCPCGPPSCGHQNKVLGECLDNQCHFLFRSEWLNRTSPRNSRGSGFVKLFRSLSA